MSDPMIEVVQRREKAGLVLLDVLVCESRGDRRALELLL